MAVLMTSPFMTFLDDDGVPLASGKVYAYDAYTTNKRNTFTAFTGAVANANPAILDSAGRAEIWLSGSYTFWVTDKNDKLIRVVDNVSAFGTSSGDADDITTDFSEVVAALGDSIIFSDLSDRGAAKRDTVQGVIDLKNDDLVLIETQMASSDASIDFTTGISSTYETYILIINDLVPATDGAQAYLRTSTDASTFDSGSSDYSHAAVRRIDNSTSISGQADASASEIALDNLTGIGFATGEGFNTNIKLHSPAGTRNTLISFTSSFLDAGGKLVTYKGSGQRLSSADVTGLQVIMSTGNISSGSFRLYGVAAT